MFSSATGEWSTPQDFFDRLNEEFHFTLDPCATKLNAKCRRFFTKKDDGLTKKWTGRVFVNPPYGRAMTAWLKKAVAEKSNGVTTVALIPARTNTGWWHDIIQPNSDVEFVRGRPKFGWAKHGLPQPLALAIFRANKTDQTAGENPATKGNR